MTRDPLDDLADPGLRVLFRHLTSDPTPDELSGEDAALAMFRAANAPPVPVRSRRSHRRSRAGGRLVAVGTAAAVLGGFAAAAYAEVLPGPLQRIAHDIIGAPNRPHVPRGPSRSVGSASRAAARSHSHSPNSSPQPGHSPSHPHSPSPSASPGSPTITIAAAQRQITAGDSVRITASLSYGGHPAKDTPLSLTELPAGRRTTWRVVGRAATGSQGGAVFTVVRLTTNASFRIVGPDQITSSELSIVVIPPVSVSLVPGHGKHSDLLLVAAPLAQRGDAVELEVWKAGQWQRMLSHRLRKTGQAEFSLAARKISVTYRVVLLATAQHGESVSSSVPVPARGRGRGTG